MVEWVRVVCEGWSLGVCGGWWRVSGGVVVGLVEWTVLEKHVAVEGFVCLPGFWERIEVRLRVQRWVLRRRGSESAVRTRSDSKVVLELFEIEERILLLYLASLAPILASGHGEVEVLLPC